MQRISVNHQLIAAVLIWVIIGAGCGEKPAPTAEVKTTGTATALPANSWVVPPDVNNGKNASQNDWWNFAWQTFVALNWPSAAPSSSGIVGLPNTQLSLGA